MGMPRIVSTTNSTRSASGCLLVEKAAEGKQPEYDGQDGDRNSGRPVTIVERVDLP